MKINQENEQLAGVNRPGNFCVSLDFELMWGVRDKRTIDQYGKNVLGGRDAVRRMLDIFHDNDIRATWAAVGMLFCETKDELLASLPKTVPSYRDERLSNYSYLDEVGDTESDDPYHFAASLLGRIRSCPGQEIATHTFSHYYCLEPGQTRDQFAADLDAAIQVASRFKVELKSIVFPRNQYDDAAIAVCADKGISVFRGNRANWLYRPSPGAQQTLPRRAVRLADSYVNLSGTSTVHASTENGLVNVCASQFLRPYSSRLDIMEPLRLTRITRAMTAAARQGETFHLWWHPHNQGIDQSENFMVLLGVLDHFKKLRSEYGMNSYAMCDFCA